MKLLRLLGLLGALLPAQVVVLENVATAPQRNWTFVGLHDTFVPKAAGSASAHVGGFDRPVSFVPAPHGVWVLADLPATCKVKVDLAAGDKPTSDPAFEWHPAIDLWRTLPYWTIDDRYRSEEPRYWAPGAQRPPGAFVRVIESDAAHQTWHIRTRIAGANLTIDYWARIGSAHSTIEWTMHATYGTVQAGEPISVQLGHMVMRGAYPFHLDFRKRTGLPPPVQEEPEPSPRYAVMLSLPAQWWSRACRVELRGAMLCAADEVRKEGRPICGVWNEWQDRWLSMGALPADYAGSQNDRNARLATYLNPPAGWIYEARKLCQPKEPGTTGEQEDFGATNDARVVTLMDPWAVHDALWHVQSYGMRHTSNREKNGDPVRAIDHPNCKTWNLRPDERFNAPPNGDMIGWPRPVPYSWPGTGFYPGDDQHFSDGMLDAMILLTRDPALCAVMQDQLEMRKLALPPAGDFGIGSPRGVGRVMLSLANAAWLGFADATPMLNERIEHCWRNASMFKIPQDAAHTIRILDGLDEAKYGWFDEAGKPVIGWQGWQNTIAAIGLYAGWRVTKNEHALTLAGELATTVTRHVFYQSPPLPGWLHVYAMAWNKADPGAPWPASDYYPQQPNYHIWTDGACARWSYASLHLMTVCKVEAEHAKRAAAILQWLGPSRNWYDSRWWAVR